MRRGGLARGLQFGLAGAVVEHEVLDEAAALDGAGPLQRFRWITLPLVRNTLVFTALMTTILAFRVFDQVHILTHGGPAGATSTLMFELVRSAFERLQMGRACALTVLFVGIVVLLTSLQRLVSGRLSR